MRADLFNFKLDRDPIERVTLALSAGSAPLSKGVGAGTPVKVPPGETWSTIFGSGNDTMPFNQQTHNGCGTASLANITSYLLGESVDRFALDHSFRRWDIFTAPSDMVKYARDRGLEAEMYNNGTVGELKSFVDQGIPIQALVSLDGDGGALHYLAVVGYGTDAAGKEFVLVHDSNHGDDPSTPANEGSIQKIPMDDFLREWKAVPFGFENFYIAYAPHGTKLPPGRDDGIEGTLATADGVADIINGLDRTGHFWESPFTIYRGVFDLEAGVVETVGGGIAAGLQLGAGWLHDKVEGIPVVENVVQFYTDVISGAGAEVADVVAGTANSVEDLGQAVEDLGKADFEGFAENLGESVVDEAKGVGNAIADLGGGIVDGVKDLFSGW